MAATKLLSDNGVTSGITGYQLTGGNDGTLQLQTTTSGGTATTAMTIDTSQNVGIGTGAPDTKVHVYSSAGNSFIQSARATQSTGEVGFQVSGGTSGVTWYMYQPTSSNSLQWYGNGATRMVIDSSGNVGIGTSSPATALEVKGSSPSINVNGTTSASFRGYSIRSNGTEIASMLAEASAGENRFTAGFSGFGGFQTFYTNGLERARIDSSGNLLVGTTSSSNAAWRVEIAGGGLNVTGNVIQCVPVYNNTTAAAANMVIGSNGQMARSTSALKYKQDVRDLESIDISKLRAVRYKSKCEIDNNNKDYFGLIADEVHNAGITELVNYNDVGEIEGFQYERLTAVLLKAIQEQQAIIEQLRADVAQLKGQA